jgi:peptide chain release factor
MPLFNVTAEKVAALERRMHSLGIAEADLVERFVKGSGKGGQKINKTSSCVYLLHQPTGTEVKCQRGRSQAMNRFLARRELCERLDEAQQAKASAREQAREKIRRQKRRRSRRQRARMLDDKRMHGEKKARRSPVRPDHD